jgi:hypothetical protein
LATRPFAAFLGHVGPVAIALGSDELVGWLHELSAELDEARASLFGSMDEFRGSLALAQVGPRARVRQCRRVRARQGPTDGPAPHPLWALEVARRRLRRAHAPRPPLPAPCQPAATSTLPFQSTPCAHARQFALGRAAAATGS